jgi:hypothetical protein
VADYGAADSAGGPADGRSDGRSLPAADERADAAARGRAAGASYGGAGPRLGGATQERPDHGQARSKQSFHAKPPRQDKTREG